VIALAAAPLLAGCFGSPATRAVKSSTGDSATAGGTSIPKDFPKDIPVYHGKVDSAAALGSGAKTIWNISIEVPDPDALSDIKAALTKAGFTTEAEGNAGKVGASLIATGKNYGVSVLLAKGTHDGFVANYTVSPEDDSN
jgi:hypothetical protein